MARLHDQPAEKTPTSTTTPVQQSRLTVENGEESVLGVAVEGVHHAAPVLVDLRRHALVVVPATVVARLYAVARVRAHLNFRKPGRDMGISSHVVFLVLDYWFYRR